MPELKPALFMPYSERELRPRVVTGRTREPLVPVTDELRNELSRSLRAAAGYAAQAGGTPDAPATVKLRLRPRALAKSNRPYSLLADVELTPIGATTPGELLLPGTATRLQNLSRRVERASSQLDRFNISTIDTIEPWDPIRDAFGVNRREDAEAVLEESAEQHRSLRVTFFPWVSEVFGERLASGSTPAITSGRDEALVELFAERFGLEVSAPRLLRGQPVAYIRPDDIPDLEALEAVNGIRTVSLAPEFSSYDMGSSHTAFAAIEKLLPDTLTLPTDGDPVVGILDAGVDSVHLEPAVTGRTMSVAPADADPWHGTFVAGLVMAGAQLNPSAYPDDVARVHDAHVMPKQSVDELELFERVREAVLSAPHVKIWNCSFAGIDEGAREYGTFANQLDELSDEAEVLFVQAAGNYTASSRPWPPKEKPVIADRLASPAEALRSITVGARAHLGGFVSAWAPASYTRRGPNFADLTKPDVSHAGGDRDPIGEIGKFGIFSIIPSDHIAESLGTSFAAPAVSAIAANLWDEIQDAGSTPTPALVKGLLVHSAFRNTADDPTIDDAGTFRQFYGWGTPSASSFILADEPHTLTTVHEVLMTPGSNWYKPLPVPPPLLNDEGKFAGEVTLTISYAPPVDAGFGAEAIRYDVSGGFGAFRVGDDGVEHFKSLTQPGASQLSWERQQKADGKWAPVKTHRAVHAQGVAGGDWALRLELTERVTNEMQLQQRVYVIVTFRSLDASVDIYTPGVQAFNDASIENRELIRSGRIRVSAQQTN